LAEGRSRDEREPDEASERRERRDEEESRPVGGRRRRKDRAYGEHRTHSEDDRETRGAYALSIRRPRRGRLSRCGPSLLHAVTRREPDHGPHWSPVTKVAPVAA